MALSFFVLNLRFQLYTENGFQALSDYIFLRNLNSKDFNYHFEPSSNYPPSPLASALETTGEHQYLEPSYRFEHFITNVIGSFL
jgi:hypothetical protein